jgi:hypothetical protein
MPSSGQAVDGVRVLGLGGGELELGAAEDVPPAIDPVRPGASSWPAPPGGSSSASWPAITG